MPMVEKSIDIRAAVQSVFNMIANQPERMPEWWPPYELNERVTPAPTQVGSISRYVYNMLGVKIKGEHQVTTMEVNKRLVVKTISGVDSTFDFRFTPAQTGTHLTIQVNYALPGSVIGQLLNKVAIEQKNEADLRDGLNNLKAILERETRV